MHLPPPTNFRTALGIALMNLHTTKRLMMQEIEDAKRQSLPTAELELELASNHDERATFMALLHAS
jgi:hypothetical protein